MIQRSHDLLRGRSDDVGRKFLTVLRSRPIYAPCLNQSDQPASLTRSTPRRTLFAGLNNENAQVLSDTGKIRPVWCGQYQARSIVRYSASQKATAVGCLIFRSLEIYPTQVKFPGQLQPDRRQNRRSICEGRAGQAGKRNTNAGPTVLRDKKEN
jgi:hypothetical protein